jgi:predicted kinase
MHYSFTGAFMEPIFLLAGAPAVGKSTSAKALAEKFPKSIHISVDALRDMVVSGFVLPGGEWGAELVEQLIVARTSAARMAEIYNKAGFAVVIDDFWDPNSSLSEYEALFQNPNVQRVLLFPNRQAAEARNIKRSGSSEAGAYIADGIRMVYESLNGVIQKLQSEGWLVVDTSDKTVDETIDHILEMTA